MLLTSLQTKSFISVNARNVKMAHAATRTTAAVAALLLRHDMRKKRARAKAFCALVRARA